MNGPLLKWLQWLLPVFALVSFGFTFWHLWEDRTASAGTAAAIGFGLLLFRILPDLESIQVLGMQAKLRQRIAEADELMDALRNVASAQSRVAVLSVAYSNRLGGMDWEEKSETYDELMEQLSDIGIEQSAIDSIAEPYLRMASRDLLAIFTGGLYQVLPVYRKHYEERLKSLKLGDTVPNDPGAQAELQTLQQTINALRAERVSELFSAGEDYRNIKRTGRSLLESMQLAGTDAEHLDRLLSEVSQLSKELWDTKRIPNKTLGYLEKMQPSSEKKFKEYFPDGAAGPTDA